MRRSNVVLIPALAQLNMPKLGIPTLLPRQLHILLFMALFILLRL